MPPVFTTGLKSGSESEVNTENIEGRVPYQRHSLSSSPTLSRMPGGPLASHHHHHSCYSTLHQSLLPLFSTAVISGSVPPAAGSPGPVDSENPGPLTGENLTIY